jgi:hypothetical protein
MGAKTMVGCGPGTSRSSALGPPHILKQRAQHDGQRQRLASAHGPDEGHQARRQAAPSARQRLIEPLHPAGWGSATPEPAHRPRPSRLGIAQQRPAAPIRRRASPFLTVSRTIASASSASARRPRTPPPSADCGPRQEPKILHRHAERCSVIAILYVYEIAGV